MDKQPKGMSNNHRGRAKVIIKSFVKIFWGVSNHWNGIKTGMDWNGIEHYGIAK